MFDRNRILNDLRHNVIEATIRNFQTGNNDTFRITLQPQHMPDSHNNSVDNKREQAYHNENPEMIAAWNVRGGGWVGFNINNLLYCQALDGY